MADSVDALGTKLQSLSLTDDTLKQTQDLLCFAKVEASVGAPRNILIHATEDMHHRFPHAICDLRKVYPSLDLALKSSQGFEGIDIRITCVVRLLDFCREHYYLLLPKEQKQIHKVPIVAKFLKSLVSAFPNLDEEKRRNQFRNFLVYRCKMKWAKPYVNNARSLQEAYETISSYFHGNATYATAAELIETAKQEGGITGLSDFGQALHILKSSELKTRVGDTGALVKSGKRLLSFVGFQELVELAESLIIHSNGLRYLSLEADEQTIADLRAKASVSEEFAHQVAPFVKTKVAKTLRDVPDIGLLITDKAFINSDS